MRGGKRAPNFTLSEKNLLIDLVAEKESIIESKRTDKQSNIAKETAWETISEKYNGICATPRNVGTLKGLWDNLKRRYRVAEKIEGITSTLDVRIEKIKDLVNYSSFDGYTNYIYDSGVKIPFSPETLTPKLHSQKFELEEKELLLQLISENIAVVENKKNDKISIKEKEQIWENIAIMFNAQVEHHRTLDSLKLWWLNTKFDVVKLLQSDQYRGSTDGGETLIDPFMKKVIDVLRKSGFLKQKTVTQSGQNKTVDYITDEFVPNLFGKSILKTTPQKKRLLSADAHEVAAEVEIDTNNIDLETKGPEEPEEIHQSAPIRTSEEKLYHQSLPIHSVNTNAKKVRIVASGENPVIDVVKPKFKPVCSMTMFLESLAPDAKSLTPSRQRLFKEKMLSTLNSLLEEQENDPSSSSHSFNANIVPSHIIYIQPSNDS